MKAAIDIGSNSLRLLQVGDDHQLIRQKVAETRLGEGFREGEISSAAIGRTLEVLDLWNQELVGKNITDVRVFATSAVRDASNREEFCQIVENRIRRPLRVLSGEEEAWYSFHGATGGFDFSAESALLIDIGGGSTEVAAYENGRLKGISMPFGAVRWKVMAYRRAEVKRAMNASLARCHFDNPKHFIAVGGTATTAAAIVNHVADYKRSAIHGQTIDCSTLTELQEHLAAIPPEERKNVVGLPAARADIILFGLEILDILFELLDIPLILVSDWGILDGILMDEKKYPS